MSDSVIKQDLELFDEEISGLADTDSFLQEYANIERFRSTKCYIKTKFHKKFSAVVAMRKLNLRNKIDYMYGIQGMGKTTSLLYFVLECLKRNEKDIHYVDLDVIKDDPDKLKTLAENDASSSKGCLIVDHHTLENITMLDEIKNIFKKKNKMILMETGYTASIYACSFELGKDMQLTKKEFDNIWNVSIKSAVDEETAAPLLGKGRDVYVFNKGRYILSPRLLYFILDQMLYGRSITDAFVMYEIDQRNRIQEFSVTEDEVFSRFCRHTRALAHYIPENGDLIFPAHVRKDVFIAINVFEANNCVVSKDDLEMDARLKVLDLEEGEEYIKVRHLVPEVAVHWRRKLPCDFKHVLAMTEDQALATMFQYSGAHKCFVDLLVEFQKEQKMAIYPNAMETTVYEPSKSSCEMKIEHHCSVFVGMSCDNFVIPYGDAMANSIQTDFQFVEKNVAKCAIFMKNHIRDHEDQSMLMYPDIGNLMGIDYFLYLPNKVKKTGEASSAKKPRHQNTLYLMQVVTGATNNGEIVGRSLEIIKKNLSELELIVHVVIITSVEDQSYRLLKCYFENLSVINLSRHKELFEKNHVLYQFIIKLAEKTKNEK